MKSKLLLIIFSLFIFSFCSSENIEEKGSKEYLESVNKWSENRESRLKEESGWLNLVGLFWLNEGENTFGSDSKNNLVFPNEMPKNIGVFSLNDSIVTVNLKENSGVKINEEFITSVIIKSDIEDSTTIMSYNNYKWFLIKRGDKFGIRLRDLNADLAKNFPGINRFPINSDWQITSKFYPYNPTKQINIPTIIGTVDVEDSPGYVEFEMNAKKYKMDAIKSVKGFFFVFADLTSGEETYGAGRFLSADAQNENGEVILDFNKAYNPPCAFTKYATCPLPPEQNRLKLRITAGEKNFGNH